MQIILFVFFDYGLICSKNCITTQHYLSLPKEKENYYNEFLKIKQKQQHYTF